MQHAAAEGLLPVMPSTGCELQRGTVNLWCSLLYYYCRVLFCRKPLVCYLQTATFGYSIPLENTWPCVKCAGVEQNAQQGKTTTLSCVLLSCVLTLTSYALDIQQYTRRVMYVVAIARPMSQLKHVRKIYPPILAGDSHANEDIDYAQTNGDTCSSPGAAAPVPQRPHSHGSLPPYVRAGHQQPSQHLLPKTRHPPCWPPVRIAALLLPTRRTAMHRSCCFARVVAAPRSVGVGDMKGQAKHYQQNQQHRTLPLLNQKCSSLLAPPLCDARSSAEPLPERKQASKDHGNQQKNRTRGTSLHRRLSSTRPGHESYLRGRRAQLLLSSARAAPSWLRWRSRATTTALAPKIFARASISSAQEWGMSPKGAVAQLVYLGLLVLSLD